MYVVGVGRGEGGADMKEVHLMATDDNHVFELYSVSSVQNVTSLILDNLCQ